MVEEIIFSIAKILLENYEEETKRIFHNMSNFQLSYQMPIE